MGAPPTEIFAPDWRAVVKSRAPVRPPIVLPRSPWWRAPWRVIRGIGWVIGLFACAFLPFLSGRLFCKDRPGGAVEPGARSTNPSIRRGQSRGGD